MHTHVRLRSAAVIAWYIGTDAYEAPGLRRNKMPSPSSQAVGACVRVVSMYVKCLGVLLTPRLSSFCSWSLMSERNGDTTTVSPVDTQAGS